MALCGSVVGLLAAMGLSVPSWFRADSRMNLIKRGGRGDFFSQVDRVAQWSVLGMQGPGFVLYFPQLVKI